MSDKDSTAPPSHLGPVHLEPAATHSEEPVTSFISAETMPVRVGTEPSPGHAEELETADGDKLEVEGDATGGSEADPDAADVEAPNAPTNDAADRTDAAGNSEPDKKDGVPERFTAEETDPPSRRYCQRLKHLPLRKIILGLALVGFVIFIIVDSTTNGYVRECIRGLLVWIKQNPAGGFFAFTAVMLVATVLFVPGLILTLGGGFVFGCAFGLGTGVAMATVSVFVGATLGAVVSFLIGRYLLRSWAESLTGRYKIFQAIDRALETKGMRIMTLLRLSPVVPFNVLNYVCGVTSVSFRDFTLANVAILPGTVLYVFVGASAEGLAMAGSGQSDSPIVTISTVVVGVVLGVIAIVLTGRYAKKELNKILAEQGELGVTEGVLSTDEETATNDVAPSEETFDGFCENPLM